jgi:hypothetical protein
MIIMLLKFYIIKTQNYKGVDLIESYNFNIKSIFI